MSFDEHLAERVRVALGSRNKLDEKRMFGGLAFFHRGYMACGIVGDELMVRVGPDNHAAALKRAGARPMDFTGRPMKGMVYVGAKGIRTAAQLKHWVTEAIAFADTLPARKS
jgi:TfoX/Sxy family transcriptional regulator of competence genes